MECTSREHVQLIILRNALLRNAFLLTLVESRVPKTTFMLVTKIGKLLLYARQLIVNLYQLKKMFAKIAHKIREGDAVNESRPVLCLSLFMFKSNGES